jgi:DNA-binding beta-propeller fold protein YncE
MNRSAGVRLIRAWVANNSAAFLLIIVAACLRPSLTNAQIYVTQFGSGNGGIIGAYNLDGTPIDPALIAGVNRPQAIAVAGTNLFLTKAGGEDLGQILFDNVSEYTTSGATVNDTLISPLFIAGGLAVSSTNLYVSSSSGIGKYTTSGSSINASLVSDPNHFFNRIAVSEDGTRLFATDFSAGTVSEYDANTGATINASLITGLNSPTGVAVFGSHLYVENSGESIITGPNPGTGSIGEYTLDGGVINTALISGLDEPTDLAALNGRLFILDAYTNSVGEYDATTGNMINSALVTGLLNSVGIAVVPEPSSIVLCSVAGLAILYAGIRRRFALLKTWGTLKSGATGKRSLPVFSCTQGQAGHDAIMFSTEQRRFNSAG